MKKLAKKLHVVSMLCLLLYASYFIDPLTMYAQGNGAGVVKSNQESTVINNTYGVTKQEQEPKVPKLNDIGEAEELVAKRTENTKHFLMKDGSYKLTLSDKALHYEDFEGKYQDITTDLIDAEELLKGKGKLDFKRSKYSESDMEKDGLSQDTANYRALQVPFDAKLSKKFSKGYTIHRDDAELTFKPVGAANVTGQVYNKNGVLYSQAWKQTDVLLEVEADGIKETITLNEPSAPSNFTFEVEGLIGDTFNQGELYIEPAWLQDSTGVTRDVYQTLRREGKKLYLDLNANVEGLRYPVVIDPTTRVNNAPFVQDASVWSHSPNTNFNSDSYLSVGGDSAYVARSYIRFDLSAIPFNATVSAAKAILSNASWSSKNINKHELYLSRILSSWNETTITWNNVPQIENPNYLNYGPFIVPQYGPGLVSIDMKQYVDEWRSNPSTNFGVQLRSNYEYKTLRLLSGPTLEIIYSLPYSQTVQIPITEDSFIVYNVSEKENELHNYDRVSFGTELDSDSSFEKFSYFKYNMLQVPPGAVIQNATFYLYGYAYADSYAGVCRVNGAWSEATLTGRNAPLNCTGSSVFISSKPSAWYSANITSIVQSINSSGQNDGFSIKGGSSFIGHSSESENSALRPYVEVTYEFPNQAPNAPVNLSPGSIYSGSPTINKQNPPTLSWNYSDPNPEDYQKAYQVVVYQSNGAIVVDTGKINSTSHSYTPPNLSPEQTYYWIVRTWDNRGDLVSAFSTPMYFKVSFKQAATFIRNTIPETMEAGESYPVSITVRNDGIYTWSESQGYRLGAVGDSDLFATARQYLTNSQSISTDQEYTFQFTMTAPNGQNGVGSKLTDWSMLQEGVAWFGPVFNKQINVVDTKPPIAQSITSSLGANLKNGSFGVVLNGVTDKGTGVREVRVAVWSQRDGQDDLVWYNGVNSGNGTWTVLVPFKDHREDAGIYYVHAYAYDFSGNVALVGGTEVPVEGPYRYVYDTMGRLDYEILPKGQIIDYQYDNNGNLIKTELK